LLSVFFHSDNVITFDFDYGDWVKRLLLYFSVPCGNNGLVDTDFIAGATNDPESNPVGHWPWMASIGHYDDNNNWNHEVLLMQNKFTITAEAAYRSHFKLSKK